MAAEGKPPSYLDLPEEIREMVLQHLNPKERREGVLICRAFYHTICYLDRKKTLKLDDKIMDDEKVFGSMMQSSRRFSEIEIRVSSVLHDEYSTAKRSKRIRHNNERKGDERARKIVELVQKFQVHTRRLVIYRFPMCSDEVFTEFLEAATDMEELKLADSHTLNRRNLLQKKFSKLKVLDLYSTQEIRGILDKVPDDSLKGLTVSTIRPDNELSAVNLQQFLNRQKNLNQLGWTVRDDHQMASGTEGVDLKNLRELKVAIGYRGNDSILREIVAPNLVTLKLDLYSLDSERLMHLRDNLKKSAKNVQHIEISTDYTTNNFVPTIIDLFPALKTLTVKASNVVHIPEWDQQLTSRENQSLEELIVRRYRMRPSISTFYDAINSCPNLKRIQLDRVNFTDQQILIVIQKHPRLTHFWFCNDKNAFAGHTEEKLDPHLEAIINIFRDRADFVCLTLENIENWSDHLLTDLLPKDAERIIVTRHRWSVSLTLKKKSEALDPFENFHEKEI